MASRVCILERVPGALLGAKATAEEMRPSPISPVCFENRGRVPQNKQQTDCCLT